MSAYAKPLPLLTSRSKVFYEGCKNHKLLYQQCDDCGAVVFFPKGLCPGCMSHNLAWKESRGRGKVYSYTVTRAAAPPEFMGSVPYALAIINMDEGFTIMSNIVDCDLDALACDMPVRVTFESVTDEIALPRFVPA